MTNGPARGGVQAGAEPAAWPGAGPAVIKWPEGLGTGAIGHSIIPWSLVHCVIGHFDFAPSTGNSGEPAFLTTFRQERRLGAGLASSNAQSRSQTGAPVGREFKRVVRYAG